MVNRWHDKTARFFRAVFELKKLFMLHHVRAKSSKVIH